MFKNYFKSAFRNIRKYSTHAVLNISGLAIGIACSLLILLWVNNELSYDRHFENADNLYRIIENQHNSGGDASLLVPTPGVLASALKEEYPEIIRSSRYVLSPLTLKKGDEFIEETVAAVDKDFLKMFDIRFVQGDLKNALDEPHNIVITEETARKYFGNENALGKTLTSRGYVVTVTGVVKTLPQNSHISFNFLVPLEWIKELGADIDDWDHRFYTYVELKKGTDSKIVDTKIHDFIKRHRKGSDSEIFLQNIKKIHLFSSRKYVYDIEGQGDITYVRILSLIAVFILIIACINYMNLSTAQSAMRAREIGIRKVSGASKRKIIFQFLGESFLIVFIALILAVILVELLLPGFKNLTGEHFKINYQSVGLYTGLIITFLLCSLMAGSYPALYLSSLKPLNTIKGGTNVNPGNAGFRRILVISQFTLSTLLIICTLVIRNQLSYIQNKNLGLNKDNIVYFMFPTRPGDPMLKTLKKELGNNPDIVSVTIAHPNTFNNEGTLGGFSWTGKKTGEDVLFHLIGSDEDYARTFQLDIKEGRFFSSEFSGDHTSAVINETAANVMDLKNPIGEIITTPYGSKLSIIGVVKDFHFQSLHYKIEPLIMQLNEDNNFLIKIKTDNKASTVRFIEKTFKSFNPGLPLDLHYLDYDFDKLYLTERRIGKISGYFSLLAIFISCLGLLGLSSYMTERRTKEIGIRKVNGARSVEIFSMLLKEYIVSIIIAFVIAGPAGWYSMNKWLQNFAYRIIPGWWLFALTGIIVMTITFLTVGLQSYTSACKNPVEAMRYE